MPSLYIATPCYGGLCLEKFATSMLEFQKLAARENIEVYVDFTENESLVHRARNVAVGRFLYKTKCDFFMFIDADIHFEADSILRLVRSGHDIAVAAYPKKGILWDQAAESIVGGDDRDPAKLASSLVLNFKSTTGVEVRDGFAEVLDGPTGFMVIKRSVIETMYKVYTELFCVNDHQNRDIDMYCAVFDCMIDPDSKRYLSEDYAFCRRWQKIGGTIHADVTTTLGHVGNLRFIGRLKDRLTVSS